MARGDRPFVAALAVLVAALALMALGPLQHYTAAADRVDALRHTRDQLAAGVERLEERRERLHDPEELEIIARSELGLVKPGEIPFVVIPPEGEAAHDLGRPLPDPPAADAPWYRRLGRWLTERVAGGG